MTTIHKGDVVRFHTPLADENSEHRYVLLDEPSKVEAHAENIRTGFDGKYPVMPKYRAQVRIQLVCDMTFKPIMTVPLEDLCAS